MLFLLLSTQHNLFFFFFFFLEKNAEAYVANPLNSLGVLKRTGFDYFNTLRPLIEAEFNSSESLSKIRNISNIFPDSFAYADACSGISLLQVKIYLMISNLKFLIWTETLEKRWSSCLIR